MANKPPKASRIQQMKLHISRLEWDTLELRDRIRDLEYQLEFHRSQTLKYRELLEMERAGNGIR